MKQNDFQAVALSDVVNNTVEDYKVKFETLQQVCDLLSDLINNFEWTTEEKKSLVYTWTQVIKVYWSLCEKLDITPLPKV